jgi:hypothetical protein
LLLSSSQAISVDAKGYKDDHLVAGWIHESNTVLWNNRMAFEPNGEPAALEERALGKRCKLFRSLDAAIRYKEGKEITAKDIWWNGDTLKERASGSWMRFPYVRSVTEAPGIVELASTGLSEDGRNESRHVFAPLSLRGRSLPLFKRVVLLERVEVYEFVALIEAFSDLLNDRSKLLEGTRELLDGKSLSFSRQQLLEMTLDELYENLFGLRKKGGIIGKHRIDDIKDPSMFREPDLQEYRLYLLEKARHLKEIADWPEGDYRFMFRSNGRAYYWIEEELIPE